MRWLWIREDVSDYDVSILLSIDVYQCLATSITSDTVHRESSGNIYIFTVSPTPSGSSILKLVPRIITTAAWVMWGAL